MRNIVILNSLHFSYPLPILMRVSYNTLIVKQNTSDYYKYRDFYSIKPGFDSKNKELALIRLFYCNFAQRNTQHII